VNACLFAIGLTCVAVCLLVVGLLRFAAAAALFSSSARAAAGAKSLPVEDAPPAFANNKFKHEAIGQGGGN